MSAATHTPGPWIKVGNSVFKAKEDGGKYYAEMSVAVTHTEEDARLIAAAPELLAVVQELEESAGYWSEYDVPLGIVDRIRAAIAKAEGRS